MNKEINIHGERHIINEAFLHCIKRAKRYKWSLKKWSAKDALKTKDGKILQFYDGQDYDKNKYEPQDAASFQALYQKNQKALQ